MKKFSLVMLGSVLTAIISFAAGAHHSVFADYDPTRQITIEGVLKEVWFKSPHVRFYVVVTDANGKEVMWDTHAHTPGTMHNAGWDADTIPVGAHIYMTGDPSRDGSPLLFVRSATIIETGQTVYSSLIPRDADGNPIDQGDE